MANPPLTEKLVYLALKDIFAGDEVQPRTAKGIRKKIEKYKDESKIKALVQNHGIESVSKVAQDLLDWQVFVSRAKAKVRFPEVFEVLPTQAQQPTTSKSNIATSSAAAVPSAGAYNPEELLSIEDGIKVRKGKERAETIAADSQTQSLDSVSLPLWDQHRVLVRVQYALEKTCFTFAQKRLGGVLQREGWDCAEAVELNRWPKVLLTYQEECNLNSVREVDKPLPNLLDSIAQLRHDAVHRARLSSNELSQRLTDALMLAQLLQDDGCSKFVSTIRHRIQDAIEELVRNKALLDRRLAEIKNGFAAKRADLERQEAALLEAAVREHREPTISVSGSLDPLYDGIDSTDTIHPLWRHGCNLALPNNESPGTEGNVETHVVTSATESAAEPAVTKVPDAADEENEKAKEAKKKAKEEKKKSKKEKKATKEQAKQQEEADKKAAEEEEGTAELKIGGDLGGGAVEDIHEDAKIIEQLSVPPIPVPTVDSGLVELALTGEKKDAEEDIDEDSSEVERYFECPEVVLDGYESDTKHVSKDPPLNQQVVATDTMNVTSEGRKKPGIAATFRSDDSDLQEHDKGCLSEASTRPAPTCIGKTEDFGHTKSPIMEEISIENSYLNLEAEIKRSAAIKDQSCSMTARHSYSLEESWPGSGGLPVMTLN